MMAYRYPEARIRVFAKAPVAGRVKTRLAARLGRRAAAAAYRALLRERLASLAAARIAPLELWVAPHRHPFVAALARRYGAGVRLQPHGDLGRRMRAALADARPAVLVGGDCPGLAVETVAEAVRRVVADAAVVVSPAEDGGYTLIGARQAPRCLFTCMPWGTSRVMTETRRRLQRAGIHARELPPSWDVDDWRDWRRWRAMQAWIGSRDGGQYSSRQRRDHAGQPS